MSKSIKKALFCKLSEKMVIEQLETYLKLATDGRYICSKCFRLSQKKQNLCKPVKLGDSIRKSACNHHGHEANDQVE